jgi:hypothetical protein
MSGPCCDNCVYSVVDAELWRKLMWLGEPILPRCGNHPMYPGQIHEVSGMACPNYRRRPPVPEGDFRVIPLSDGSYAYVDAADYEWLSQWAWSVVGGGYATRNNNGKTVLMHRQIMRPPRGKFVDHKDGNRANNCRSNLRVCTRKENMRNLRKQNGTVSRFKGVTYCKRTDKWFARCWYKGGDHYLGSFDDEVEAARAYDRRAVEMLGEFARLNFPREWPPERRAQVRAEYQAAKKKARRPKTNVKKEKAKDKSGKAKAGRRSHAKTRPR